MSLEAKIEALTQAVVALTAKLESANVAAPAPVAQSPAPVFKPGIASAGPDNIPGCTPFSEPVAAAPAMPAPPAFVAPAPAAAPVVPTQAVPTVAAPAPTTVPVVAAPSAPVASGTPVAMPPAPSFVAPVPVAAAAGAPFTDGKGLIDYVMGAYKAMGPQKGAQIQNVLVGLGYQNINDVKPEHYGQLYAGVEALK